MRRKLPTGQTNYEYIVENNMVYVDKTMYIEKLENLSDTTIMFLRPRKFGKTLFTSVLENYYDKNKVESFEKLFGKTYIGKNPTANKNKYSILRFNFSGIDSTDLEATLKGFREKVDIGVNNFVNAYGLDFYNNPEQTTEGLLGSLFSAFKLQKPQEKIYAIIDEYDHFANELLGFRTDDFKDLVAKNGKIRKWYEVLKEGAESVVERIFITGVAPITLDSTTSGFNIASDITKDIEFNDMLGFNADDVKYLLQELEKPQEKQEELLPIIKQNYDGYIFSNMIKVDFEKYKMYNSNMTLYFLNQYSRFDKVPEQLVDVNIISDYKKIEGFMDLCKEMGKIELLEKIVAGDMIESNLTEKFNAEISLGEKELVSLLFYLGYLTIAENGYSKSKFKIPNDVIRKIYSEYFLNYISRNTELKVDKIDTETIAREILEQGKIDKAVETLGVYLTNLSNRDYTRFDEKYVKVIFYSICRMTGGIMVKSEVEVGGRYIDILLLPMEKQDERYGVLLEFKYIKKEDYEKDNSLLKQKQEEAKEQVIAYKSSEEIKKIPNLKSYSVVAIKNELVWEKVVI